MNKLIIIGASGHGKVVVDIAKKCGYIDIVFLDDNPNQKTCAGYPVLGPIAMINEIEGDIFVAIGRADVRKCLMEKYGKKKFPVLVHPTAVISDDVSIGSGTVVMAGVVINPGTEIGKGVIVNTSCSIDHDCYVGDYCHISVGSHLCGTVKIGENTWIGAGTIISNNINICSQVITGAGAVVVKDIEEEGTYIGVPARKK